MTPPPFPAAASSGRIPELDGLRGLAILLVIFWHYVAAPLRALHHPAAVHLAHALRLSWSGVDLFFVLSGFLIGGILLDQRKAPRYFQAFYARRALRILPLYYAWLGLFFLLPLALPALARLPILQPLFGSPLPAWSYLTFTQNLMMAARGGFGADGLAITWSLAIEEQFYLVLPLLVRFVPARRLPAVLIVLGGAAPLLRLLAGPQRFYFKYVLMPCRADALLLGVLCAWALRQERWRALLPRGRPALYGMALLIFGGLGGLCLFDFPGLEGSPYLYSLLAVFYAALLLLAVTAERGPVARFFRLRGLRHLGILAYGLYLLHQSVSRLAHGLLLDRQPGIGGLAPLATTLLAAALTWALAALSWRFFEKPLVALGHRVSYGGRSRPAPSMPENPAKV